MHFKHSHPKPIDAGCFIPVRKEGSFIHSSFEICFIPMVQITYLARQLDLWDQVITWATGVQPIHVWQLWVVMTGERSSCSFENKSGGTWKGLRGCCYSTSYIRAVISLKWRKNAAEGSSQWKRWSIVPSKLSHSSSLTAGDKAIVTQGRLTCFFCSSWMSHQSPWVEAEWLMEKITDRFINNENDKWLQIELTIKQSNQISRVCQQGLLSLPT